MALTLVSELDTQTRVNAFILGWVAYNPETGVTLRRSYGNSKAGRPHKYYLVIGKDYDAICIKSLTDMGAFHKAKELGY